MDPAYGMDDQAGAANAYENEVFKREENEAMDTLQIEPTDQEEIEPNA